VRRAAAPERWHQLLVETLTRLRDFGAFTIDADPHKPDATVRRAHFVRNDRMWSSAMSRAVSIGVMSCWVSARR
jgi:hypothetical protein